MSDSSTPQLICNGKFNPQAIEEAGIEWTTRWLADRLSGNDPYVPIDPRFGEDPDALVVAILRDIGLGNPAAVVLSSAILCLLNLARAEAGSCPPYFAGVLRICQQVRLPQVAGWFSEEIRQLAQDEANREASWGGYEHMQEIVYAAMVQSPGLRTAASHASWERLLSVSRYATLALSALSQSFAERVAHLPTWWDSVTHEERQRELSQMIFTAVKTEGKESVLQILQAATDLPDDLKPAIDEALREHGVRKAFDPPRCANYHSAIFRAGYKRETLLELSAQGALV